MCVPLCSYTMPGGEQHLAMELWWRSVALQALRTYMSSIIGRGLARDADMQVGWIAVPR